MKIVLCALLSACSAPMLVHDVRIDGYDLVVERCPARGFSSCETTHEPLPVAVRAAPSAPMRATPDRVHDSVMLGRARDAIATCGVHGALRIELAVDGHGQAHGARSDGADQALTDCIAQAVSELRFEPGRERTVAFVWAEVAP